MHNLIQLLKASILSHLLIRRTLVILWHLLGTVLTLVLSFQIRFEGLVPPDEWHHISLSLPILLVVYMITFASFRLYSGMWSFFSLHDLVRVGLALAVGTAVFATIVIGIHFGFPRSVFVIEFMLMGLWMTGGLALARYLKLRGGDTDSAVLSEERVLIVGSLHDTDLLIRAVTRTGRLGLILGVVTDDPGAKGLSIHGVKVLGDTAQAADVAGRMNAQCLMILPPFNTPGQMNRLVSACADRGVACSFRIVPSLSDLATGRLTAASIRTVNIADLMARKSVNLDRFEVRRFVKGKKVLVTGAGGSIGHELCRQIAGYEPACLVLFDVSEFGIYDVDRDLRQRHPNMNLVPFVGDIRHPEEIRVAIDQAGGIDIIYHAAAYKHVPLMESNVAACFRTNVLGTARLARVAVECKVDRFVMISSDKAVRPTSMMGAAKRIAERLIAELPSNGTTFISVRFGNVLESSGSVIPLFKEQIAKGGPVTVTSPDVRRFFMTIPEAVELTLSAGTIGRNGDTMILKMGDAVRIVDLARRLIELSGLVPDKDIKITFTGMRPGEKEYEEVMTEDEGVVSTDQENIWLFRKSGIQTCGPAIDLALVDRLVALNDTAGLRALSKQYVPENMLA